MTDPNQIASSLSEAQREFLLRYEPALESQPVAAFKDVCPCNFYVTIDGRDVFFAKGGSFKPEGSTEFQDHWIAYLETGLAVRAIIERDSNGK